MAIFRKLRQLCCRHEDILRMDKDRMWLECLACGRATMGFDGLGRATRVSDTERTPARRAEWFGSALKNRAA